MLLMVVGISLVILGLAGLLFPIIPGAPLMFVGLVVTAWADDFAYVGIGTISVLAVLALLTYLVDIVAGAFGAKRFGASGWAIIGAGIGAVVGIFFGIFGVLLGPFIGACVGELSTGRELREAGRAGVGATVGLVIGAAAKIAIAFSMLGIYGVMRFA